MIHLCRTNNFLEASDEEDAICYKPCNYLRFIFLINDITNFIMIMNFRE